MDLGLILFWIVGAVLAGLVAQAKGRSYIGWVILSLFISPLLTLIALVALPTVDLSRRR